MEAIMVIRDNERETVQLCGVPHVGHYLRVDDRTLLVESVVHVNNAPLELILVEIDG